MNYLQFGPLMIQTEWLSIVVSFVIVNVLITYIYRKNSDWFSNAFLLFILVWKFSYVIFGWKMTLNNPFSALYFNGGVPGFITGAIVTSLYLLIKQKKQHQKFIVVFIYFTFMTIYELVSIIMINEYNLYTILQIIISSLFILFLTLRNRMSNSLITTKLSTLYLLINLLFYSIRDQFTSLETSTHIWLFCTILFLTKKGEVK